MEREQSGKDAASLETPISPAASNTTEPPTTGMLIQSDAEETLPADLTRWMTRYESSSQRFPDRRWSCDTSVPTKPGRQSQRRTQRTWSGTEIGHWTSVHCDGQRDDVLAHARRCQRYGCLPGRSQENWTSEVYHITRPRVRQRQHFHIPQHCFRQPNRVRTCWWGVSAECRHVGEEDVWNCWSQDVDGLRARLRVPLRRNPRDLETLNSTN